MSDALTDRIADVLRDEFDDFEIYATLETIQHLAEQVRAVLGETTTEYRDLDDGSSGVWTDTTTGATTVHTKPATRQRREVTRWVEVPR